MCPGCRRLFGPLAPTALRVDSGDGDRQPGVRPKQGAGGVGGVLVYLQQTPRRPGNDFGYRELHGIAFAYRQFALRLRGLTVVEVDHVAVQIGPHAGQVPVRVSADLGLLRTVSAY